MKAQSKTGIWDKEWASTVLLEASRSTRLYSTRDVQQRLKDTHGQAGMEQVSYLAKSGILGPVYVSGGSTSFESTLVDKLLDRPSYTLTDLDGLASLSEVDGALILRQLPLTVVDDPEVEDRPFFGTHARLFDLDRQDDRRRALDEATRKFWRIAPSRRSSIWKHIAEHGFCPLIVTIGKWCLGGRNIKALHEVESGPYAGRVCFDIGDASDWAHDVTHTWIDPGSGASAVWWTRNK
ncbi:hypothetical protein HJ590_11320 [Naumannella sp. ID2617S]|nr:hypothetical protein [Naumannella sp. ID2617S]